MHAAGFCNAVATLGTAITSEQARVLSRYTKRVIISYDADEAGQKAAKRAMQLLGEVGLDVSVLKIPDAKDPDEYIKKHGKDNFSRLLQNTKSKFEYNVEGVLSKYNLDLPQDKINAVSEIEKLISEVYSSAERDIYITSVAKRLSVDARSIKNDVDRMVSRKEFTNRRAEEKRIKEMSAGFSDRINPDFVKAPTVAKNEENILGLLLLYPDKRNRVFGDKLLTADDFFTEFNKRVFTFIESAYQSNDTSLEMMNEYFTPEEVGRITRMKINRMTLSASDESVLEEGIESLRRAMQKKEAVKNTTYEGLDAILKRKRNG
jgi:DNA primase